MYERTSDEQFNEAVVMSTVGANTTGTNETYQKFWEEYNQIQWGTLVNNHWKVFRFVGPYATNLDDSKNPTDAVFTVMAELKGADGKMHKIHLPTYDSANPHLMYRIYNKLTESDWITDETTGKKTREPRYAKTEADLYNWATTGGEFNPKKAKYNKGIKATTIMIANVIDRSDAWCKENKHTKLISRSSSTWVSKKDSSVQTSYTPGISKYVFDMCFDQVPRSGSWENFDIAMFKTGVQNPAMLMKNASTCKEKDYWEEFKQEATEEFKNSVQVGPITDEELSYERYDIQKFFGSTSYTTIEKHFGEIIKDIDSAFNTHFYDELKMFVEKEGNTVSTKETKTEVKTETEVEKEIVIENPTTVETVSRRTVIREKAPENKAEIKIASNCENKEEILSRRDEGGVAIFTYKNQDSLNLEACTDCGCMFPDTWRVCPSCGATFEIN